MKKFIPFPFYHDDVPIDISFVFAEEKPAGKRGFLKVEGRNFIFQDGTTAKFWGTNFNGSACFPEKAYAQTVAKRLAKIGINLVRFHQLDAQWHTPNIFAFTKGPRVTSGKLCPESMDRLDYLVYCLKQEGIYCYLDMLTYRKFRSDEGVENAAALADAGRPYSIFSDKLIELQKQFCYDIWKHHNPYTDLDYCDDPVFVMTEITNENELFLDQKQRHITAEPYKTEFLNKFDKWLQETGSSKKATDFDLADYEDDTLLEFKAWLQENYYLDMMDYMRRECGVKIPIAGTNWPRKPIHQRTQLVADFLDSHSYYYDWRWGEFEKHCANKSISQVAYWRIYKNLCCTAKDKPTYISEWDMPWPNEFRAEAPIHAAAVGAFQGWSGFAIHTYSYNTKLHQMNRLGKEFSSEKIGDVPFRQGVFSAWNDPAKYGLFYHAALITRRGDVSAANSFSPSYPVSKLDYDELDLANKMERTGVYFDYDLTKAHAPTALTQADDALSDTKELYHNWKKKYAWIDTPKTKCVYGFLGKKGATQLNGVSVDCKTDFAVIAMSSLTSEDICHSDNILLTTVGRAKNTGFQAKGDKLIEIGTGPVLIEPIEAEITIETQVEGLKVWAVNAEGFYIGTVPTRYQDGKLTFHVGETSQSMYYLIVKD